LTVGNLSFELKTGTFRLSCDALSLVNVLENKFGWANVMASQKSLVFCVNDSTMATEFGPAISTPTAGHAIPLTGYNVPFLTLFFNIRLSDEEAGVDIQSSELLAAQRNMILNIDIYRIEQVIRNLITNAVRDIYLPFAHPLHSFFRSTDEVHSQRWSS
jgi:hypothetical protein